MNGCKGRQRPSKASVGCLYLGALNSGSFMPRLAISGHLCCRRCCFVGLLALLRAPARRAQMPGPAGAELGGPASALLCADRQARGAGGGQRLRRACRREQQSVHGRSVLPPVLRRRHAARTGGALARLRRHRRSVGPRRHQLSRHRRRQRSEGRACRQARIRRRYRAQGSAQRSRGAAHQGREGAVSRRWNSPIPTSCRSATWCWRSAIRSASARP